MTAKMSGGKRSAFLNAYAQSGNLTLWAVARFPAAGARGRAFAGLWLQSRSDAERSGPFEFEVSPELEAGAPVPDRMRIAQRHLRQEQAATGPVIAAVRRPGCRRGGR